jgi:hypothetical protein
MSKNGKLNKYNVQDFQPGENVYIDCFSHSNILSIYEFCKSEFTKLGKMIHCLYWASGGIRSTC